MSDLEQAVRGAIHDRLQLARQPDVPTWDDEAVARIMAAAEAVQPIAPVCVSLLDGGRVSVTDRPEAPGTGLSFSPQAWSDLVTAIKAGEYDEYVTVQGSPERAVPPAEKAPAAADRPARTVRRGAKAAS